MNLYIHIELGNEAMLSGVDAIDSLKYSNLSSFQAPLEEGDSGKLRDINGNTVGKWIVLGTTSALPRGLDPI